MLSHLRRRGAAQEGFTLIELLMVTMILGILSGLVLPQVLRNRDRGADAEAKSNVRNAVSELESCFITDSAYGACSLVGSGLPVGAGAGQVQIVAQVGNTFQLRGQSTSGNTFTITKDATGVTTRTCAVADTRGCPVGGVW